MAPGKHHSAIIEALDQASIQTPVEIQVLLSRNVLDFNPLKKCQLWFSKLRIGENSTHGGILIYVNTRLKKIALFGDEKIHKKLGQSFWKQSLRTLQAELRSTHYENAIAIAISKLAENLKHNLK